MFSLRGPGPVALLVLATAGNLPAQNFTDQSQRSVRRFGPGVCGPVDPLYIKGATLTGGQPFFLSSSEVSQSARIVLATSNTETVLWAAAKGVRRFTVPIDSSIKSATFSATFDETGGTLTVNSPDGAAVQQNPQVVDTVLNCGRLVSIDAPASGVWQVTAAPSGRFWLVVHAKTDLSMVSTKFVEMRGRPGHEGLFEIHGEPVAGRTAILRVRMSSPVEDPGFTLVSAEGAPLRPVELNRTSDEEFVGEVTLPDEPFRVMVSGRDESGARFQRIDGPLFRGEVLEVIPSAVLDSVPVGETTTVAFTVRNFGPAAHVKFTAAGPSARLTPVEPPEAQLEAGAEIIVNVRLTIPADARSESDASVFLTAAADGPSESRNYARKQLTVSTGKQP